MAEAVGLTRFIALEWLNEAADCKVAGMSKDEARERLDKIIARRVRDKDNIRKARSILLNIWYGNDTWTQAECAGAWPHLKQEERLALHWALLMAYYPMFFDLCSIIGDYLEYRDEVKLTYIRSRVFEKWGARTTVEHSLPKNTQSLKDMGVLESKSTGTYTPIIRVVDNKKLVQILAVSILIRSSRDYLTWEEIKRHPALFPFDIEGASQADLFECKRLTHSRMGTDVVVSLI